MIGTYVLTLAACGAGGTGIEGETVRSTVAAWVSRTPPLLISELLR